MPRPSLALALALALPAAALAQPAAPPDAPRRIDPPGYLQGRAIGYTSPPAPTEDSLQTRIDVVADEEAQSAPEWRKDQAFADADAYDYDMLLPRFSEAAGTHLAPATSPVLAYVLRRLLVDLTGTKGLYGVTIPGYVPLAKAANIRERPFITHPDITPCDTDWIWGDKDHSYPSGHGAEGWVAALLLAEVMPERAGAIRARGLRYGDNRVVCGVHYPSDVAEGRRIAEAYFAAVASDPGFRHDLDCAIDERRRSVAAPQVPAPVAGMTAACADVARRAALR